MGLKLHVAPKTSESWVLAQLAASYTGVQTDAVIAAALPDYYNQAAVNAAIASAIAAAEQWEISCLQDLDFLLHCIRATFLLLRYFGLKVNPTKSRIMLNLRGHQAKQWQRQWILRTPQKVLPADDAGWTGGAHPCCGKRRVPGCGPQLSSCGGYYGQAPHLQRVLNGKHALTLSRRLRIWHTCVSTSLYHGIACVGVTPVVFARIRRLVAKHVRALSGSPAHVDRESTLTCSEGCKSWSRT